MSGDGISGHGSVSTYRILYLVNYRGNHEKHLIWKRIVVVKHSDYSFRSTELQPDEVQLAKVLADKAIFVRKKLDNDVQYALNKRIRFVRDGYKK